MNDFNLYPEVMGFGRPERVLAEQPTPVPPGDAWKVRGDGFEVNGLGQLRTAFALPASEREIAASMRHADAAPAPVVGFGFYEKLWAAFDPGAEGGDKTAVIKKEWLHGDWDIQPLPMAPPSQALLELMDCAEKCKDEFLLKGVRRQLVAEAQLRVNPPVSMVLGGRRVGKALALDQLRAAAGVMDAQDVPRKARLYGGPLCECDNCTAASLGGRFSNPTKIMAEKPQGVNYTARYMAMTDAELDATRHTPQECDEDGEAFRRELRIRKL